MVDRLFMDRALFHAARGRGRTTPNPAVGAVVVADGVVVGSGFHARAGEAHAEVNALRSAGSLARGATLYCTLEPCAHTARTGPCAVAIVEAGIRRVVVAMEDPHPLVAGRGVAYLRAHGVDVDLGVGAAAAHTLNQPFLTAVAEQRPFVILKAATSLDGYIAARPGERTQLTSAAANRHAQTIRAEVDAIAVGSGTILADDPLLTVRDVYRERPLTRVVFDRRMRIPAHARLLSTVEAGPVMIMTSAAAAGTWRAKEAERRGAEIVVIDGTIRAGLNALGARGITSLLLEGGAAMHLAAWDEHVVDYVRLYVTPHVIDSKGARGVPFLEGRRFSSTFLVDSQTVPLGPDAMIEGYVHGPR